MQELKLSQVAATLYACRTNAFRPSHQTLITCSTIVSTPCTCAGLPLPFTAQGTLREALDRKRLPRVPGTTFLQPIIALSLSHDIAAALLHLHSEGIM